MNGKSAMSGMGFAIAIVIMLGIVMIFSAPAMLDGNKEPAKEEKTVVPNQNVSELQELENRLNARIENLERNQSDGVSNRYICKIEGNVDENGTIVPINNNNNYSKFVFICEYRN